jgi:hypothetical protein
MPFILVNHDSFISDGPVLVKLQVEADRLCGERTQRGSADTRAGSYDRTLQISAGEVNLNRWAMPQGRHGLFRFGAFVAARGHRPIDQYSDFASEHHLAYNAGSFPEFRSHACV